MKTNRIFKSCTLLIVAGLLTANCAAIFKGSSADIRVNSNPSGADIIINGIDRGVTPQTMSLSRNENYVLTFKKDGYEDVNVEVKKKFDVGTTVVGNIFSWGLIGIIVDVATGAAYSLTPADIDANFDTMAKAGLINPDELNQKEGEINVIMITTEQWEAIQAAK